MMEKLYSKPEDILHILQELAVEDSGDDDSVGGLGFETDEVVEEAKCIELPNLQQQGMISSSSSSDDEEINLEDNGPVRKRWKPERRDNVMEISGQDYVSKDGTKWIESNFEKQWRFSHRNVVTEAAGPTGYAKRKIQNQDYVSAWSLLLDQKLLEYIAECTKEGARRVYNNELWELSIEELMAFFAILYARGAYGFSTLSVETLWSTRWGHSFFRDTMPRDRFKTIMRFLRFDKKSARSQRLKNDEFALASHLWNSFVTNSLKCYKPSANITMDEQLFPSKCRCRFTQYMPNKPDKFGIKFWLTADVDTKYMLNGFPYLGKDEERDKSMPLGDFVVLKLMEPFLKTGRNVTCDNFFTSMKLAKELDEKSTSLVGTVRKSRRELPESLPKRRMNQYDSIILNSEDTGYTLTFYQGKKNKSVFLLSSMHRSVKIEEGEKKKPETIVYYNQTKCGVDMLDQMARLYTVRSGSRKVDNSHHA